MARTLSGIRPQDAIDAALVGAMDDSNRRERSAKKLALEQAVEMCRLEALFEAGKSSLGHEKAIRAFAQIQAMVAIETMKEIHHARQRRIICGDDW